MCSVYGVPSIGNQIDTEDVYTFGVSSDGLVDIDLDNPYFVWGSTVDLLDADGNVVNPEQGDASLFNLTAGVYKLRIKKVGTSLIDYALSINKQ